MFNVDVVNVVTLLSYMMTYNSGGQPGLLSYRHVLSLLVCEMPFARVPLPRHHININMYGKIIHFNLFSYAWYGLQGATDILHFIIKLICNFLELYKFKLFETIHFAKKKKKNGNN